MNPRIQTAFLIAPIVAYFFESDHSGGFISMDGIETVIILLLLFPLIVYLIYRLLPKDFSFKKITSAQRIIIIAIVLTGLLLLLYALTR